MREIRCKTFFKIIIHDYNHGMISFVFFLMFAILKMVSASCQPFTYFFIKRCSNYCLVLTFLLACFFFFFFPSSFVCMRVGDVESLMQFRWLSWVIRLRKFLKNSIVPM